jgi:hypothetical protein
LTGFYRRPSNGQYEEESSNVLLFAFGGLGAETLQKDKTSYLLYGKLVMHKLVGHEIGFAIKMA